MEAPMTPPPMINTSGCAMVCSLRRLMHNSGPTQKGRSPDRMLQPNLSPKAVADGPRLLPGRSVRDGGRLVAGPWGAHAARAGPPADPEYERGAHAGAGGAVAALAQRARLLARRPGALAPVLPAPGQPESAPSPHPCGGAGLARAARRAGHPARRAARRLSRAGPHAAPGQRAGAGVPAWSLCRPGVLWPLRLQDGVGL